jgi:hypothetical protein
LRGVNNWEKTRHLGIHRQDTKLAYGTSVGLRPR